MEQVNLVQFVPDNFDGFAFDPDAKSNLAIDETYQDSISRRIQAWESNARYSGRGERRYVIYQGWSDLDPGNSIQYDTSLVTPGMLNAWYTSNVNGDYRQWFNLLTSRIQDLAPSSSVELMPMGDILAKVWLNLVLADRTELRDLIPPGRMFEDGSHGRETWYCLAGAVWYMWAFKKKVPANFGQTMAATPAWEVHPALIQNWGRIADFAWYELKF
jgi:hypothetical protein